MNQYTTQPWSIAGREWIEEGQLLIDWGDQTTPEIRVCGCLCDNYPFHAHHDRHDCIHVDDYVDDHDHRTHEHDDSHPGWPAN